MDLGSGFLRVATGSFPLEVIKGDGGWKCRQADIDRVAAVRQVPTGPGPSDREAPAGT